jgi:hypothetical protein
LFKKSGDTSPHSKATLPVAFGTMTTSLLHAAVLMGAAVACIAAEPLPQAHAHNDYEHSRPLLDALDHGFCSVEADIWLVDDALLVAHDREKVDPQKTLEKLYLDPLLKRVKENRGRVYSNSAASGFTLLIDLKSGAEATYAALHPVLERYREMLTEFTGNSTRTGAVTIILSGNRPTETVKTERVRYAGIDGRLPDLDSNPPRHLIPLISDNWRTHFQWRGEGALPEEERLKLQSLVKRAHAQGRKIRFWAIPDTPAAWAEMRRAGVDLINTDDLSGLAKFLKQPDAR